MCGFTYMELMTRHFGQTNYILGTIANYTAHNKLSVLYNDFITALLGLLIIMIRQQPKNYA